MAHIDITGNIGSLLDFYKHEKQIFGRCPHCRLPFRLSEVKLTYGKEPPRDLLTRMRTEQEQLRERLEDLETDIESMEMEHETEIKALDVRWRDKVATEVDRQLVKTTRKIRKDAVAQSRVSQLGKTLEKLAPMFPGFGHHPYDVRPVFDPIDFVIFDGYFHGEVTDVTFVEFKTGGSGLSPIQNSIRSAVKRKRVHFQERRIRKETLRLLTEGRSSELRQLVD
jgi:predicted Holliday junction resolvase-like endonuclease